MRKITPKTDKYSIGPSKATKESKPIYPSFRLELEHIPEAKKWEIGKSYNIALKVKMVGISQSRFDNSADFEVHEIETSADKDDKKS